VWAYARGSELGYRAALYNVAWLHQRELAHGRVHRRRRFDDELARWPSPPPLPPTAQVRVDDTASNRERAREHPAPHKAPRSLRRALGLEGALLRCRAQPGTSPAAARQLHLLLRVRGGGLEGRFGKQGVPLPIHGGGGAQEVEAAGGERARSSLTRGGEQRAEAARRWRARTMGMQTYTRLSEQRLTSLVHRRWAHVRLAEAHYYGPSYGGHATVRAWGRGAMHHPSPSLRVVMELVAEGLSLGARRTRAKRRSTTRERRRTATCRRWWHWR